MRRRLLEARAWVFDLDGTLTKAQHDFAAIKAKLGLPSNQGLLESLRSLPPELAWEKSQHIDAWELETAARAQAAPGAQQLLEELLKRGVCIGILTRNTRRNAWETLRAAGLNQFFRLHEIVGRGDALPKPDPDGLLRLAESWSFEPSEQVMVGDFLYDLEAGRAAGALTIHIDVTGQFPWPEMADVRISSLEELVEMLTSPLAETAKVSKPVEGGGALAKKRIKVTADADRNPDMGLDREASWF